MDKVYIMIDAQDGSRQVVDAREYQQLALNDYIDNKIVDDLAEDLAYEIDDNICFTIKKFNSISYGLSGEYLDVFCYVKENNSMFLISRNFKKLSALCGFLNRVIECG
jgi:hypothetical protein